MNESAGRRDRMIALLLLVAALGYGGTVRLARKSFGLPYLHHWDEPALAGTALRMLQTGDFNPHFFNYPTLTTYACLAVDVLHYYRLMGGAPDPAGRFESLDELRIGDRLDYPWTVSHPSFYAANRTLIVAFGLLSLLLVYDIGQRLSGGAAGGLAAVVLAALPVHVMHSVFVTTDVPMAFFFLASARQALVYLEAPSAWRLAGSLAAAGLTVATKYNGFPAIACPLLAWVATPRGRRPTGAWLLCLSVPPAIFLATNPYVLLDFASFLRHSGAEVRHYMVRGHRGAEVEPGLGHLMLALRYFRSELSAPLLLAAVAGIVRCLARQAGPSLAVFLPPLGYLLLMTGQRASFDRNFIAVLAFLSIGVGAALDGIARRTGVMARSRRSSSRPSDDLCIGLALLVVCGCLHPWRSFVSSRALGRARDTRSLAVDRVLAEATPALRVGVSDQLHVHPSDLARLPATHGTFDQSALHLAKERYDLLLLARLEGADAPSADAATAGSAMGVVPGAQVTSSGPNPNPEVRLVRTAGARPWIVTLDPATLPGRKKRGFLSDADTDGKAVLQELDIQIPPEATRLVLATHGRHPHLDRWRLLGVKVTLDDGTELAPAGREGASLIFSMPVGNRHLDRLTIESSTYQPPAGGLPRGLDIREITLQ